MVGIIPTIQLKFVRKGSYAIIIVHVGCLLLFFFFLKHLKALLKKK